MAVYFPKGKKGITSIKQKFLDDLLGVSKNGAGAMAFVTNQEITLKQRAMLVKAAKGTKVQIYHLERIATILDQPKMAVVKLQFLNIGPDVATLNAIKAELDKGHERLIGFQTGGDTFCYWMLYEFDLSLNIGKWFTVIKKGEYPLYDLSIRIRDMDVGKDIYSVKWGELNAPAQYKGVYWRLPHSVYYRIFFFAQNGAWNQDLILKRSEKAKCWLAATIVKDKKGRDVVFEYANRQPRCEFSGAGFPDYGARRSVVAGTHSASSWTREAA
jgi:hypothetical protein